MSRLAGSRTGRSATAVWGAFACGVGVASNGVLPAPVAGVALAGSCGLVALSLLSGGRRLAALVALIGLSVVAGMARGAAAVEAPGPGRIDGHLGSRPVTVLGTVREATPGAGSAVTIDAERVLYADTDVAVAGGLLVSGPNVPAVAPGDQVEVDASGLRSPNLRPGPESEATLERQDVEAVAVSPLVSITRHGGLSPAGIVAWTQARLVSAVDAVLPEPQAALVLGVAFGIHQTLAAEVRAPLQDAGLIHVVVVSGLKVVMLLGLIGALGAVLGWSPRRRLLIAVPTVAAYVLLSGAGPAAIRSALMAGAALLARSGGRRTDPLPMLALAAAAMLGIDPQLVRDPGFQLSFLGTAGIVVLAEPLARRLPGPRLLAEPFAVTVAAQVATVPVMAGTFGVVAIVGPIANALVLPLLPVLIVLGGAGAAIGALMPVLAWPLLQVAGLGASFIVLTARALTALPGAFIPVGTWPPAWTIAEVSGLAGAAAIAGATRWRRSEPPRRAAAFRTQAGAAVRLAPGAGGSGGSSRVRPWVALSVAGGVVAAGLGGMAASRPDGVLHVTVLSTGDAPAVLVRGDGGTLALIDGGRSPSMLLQALGRVLAPTDHRIDLVVVTGGEEAAVAGLAGLPGHYAVGTVMASRALNPGGANVVAALQAAGATAVDPAGRAWTLDGATWSCLGFLADATERAMCAVSVVDHSGRLLVLGDAGTDDQEQLCAMYGGSLRADVLVTEPGGSLSTALLGITRPSSIAIPTAQGGYAAPAPGGYRVIRTATNGDLQYVGGSDGLIETA